MVQEKMGDVKWRGKGERVERDKNREAGVIVDSKYKRQSLLTEVWLVVGHTFLVLGHSRGKIDVACLGLSLHRL